MEQNQNPGAIAKIFAKVKLNDHFGEENLTILNFLSADILPHLNDYFILNRDLSSNIQEEIRRCYFDYSFAVVPIHKVFECYLVNILEQIFNLEVTRELKKSVGHYLSWGNKEKIMLIEGAEKEWKLKFTKDEWLTRLNALADHWRKNRNPLTHSEEEKISSLSQAEQVANALIREINLSINLFKKELFNPVFARIRETEARKEKEQEKLLTEEKKKKDLAIEELKRRASLP